jgi:hypothetical protein
MGQIDISHQAKDQSKPTGHNEIQGRQSQSVEECLEKKHNIVKQAPKSKQRQWQDQQPPKS